MNKTTYYIISGILCGTIIIGGRFWFDLSFIERIITLLIVGGLFEVIYQKIKLKWRNNLSYGAMGHSCLNVSLTYLRGLEVVELVESDVPMIL